MNKEELVRVLFDDIKDEIEYDSDVLAIYKLLTEMVYINKDYAYSSWIYIINNYELEEIQKDIDLTVLFRDFPCFIINKFGIKAFMEACLKIRKENTSYIIKTFFNVFKDDSLILRLIENYIKEDKIKEERELLEIIHTYYLKIPKDIFDFAFFLREIITFHIKYKKLNVDLLTDFTDRVENVKDRAVLKTLLIDYLKF